MLSESKCLVDFLVGFLGKKPQTLLIPTFCTTILYDKAIQQMHMQNKWVQGKGLHSIWELVLLLKGEHE